MINSKKVTKWIRSRSGCCLAFGLGTWTSLAGVYLDPNTVGGSDWNGSTFCTIHFTTPIRPTVDITPEFEAHLRTPLDGHHEQFLKASRVLGATDWLFPFSVRVGGGDGKFVAENWRVTPEFKRGELGGGGGVYFPAHNTVTMINSLTLKGVNEIENVLLMAGRAGVEANGYVFWGRRSRVDHHKEGACPQVLSEFSNSVGVSITSEVRAPEVGCYEIAKLVEVPPLTLAYINGPPGFQPYQILEPLPNSPQGRFYRDPHEAPAYAMVSIEKTTTFDSEQGPETVTEISIDGPHSGVVGPANCNGSGSYGYRCPRTLRWYGLYADDLWHVGTGRSSIDSFLQAGNYSLTGNPEDKVGELVTYRVDEAHPQFEILGEGLNGVLHIDDYAFQVACKLGPVLQRASLYLPGSGNRPVISQGGSLVVSSSGDGDITSLTVSSSASSVQISISAQNGTLTLNGVSGLTFTTGDGFADASMVFSGSVTDVNAALSTLSYQGNTPFGDNDIIVISVTANDLSTTTVIEVLVGPPSAPSNLQATAISHSEISLSWTDNADTESGFKIERKTGASGNYQEVGSVWENVTDFVDRGLQPETQYYYRIRAVNMGGASSYSSEADATTFAAVVPSAPSNLAATSLPEGISLSWTDNSGNEAGFKVERKTGAGGQFEDVALLGRNATTFVDSALAGGNTYYYRVRAYNLIGSSDYSSEVNATPVAPPANAPANLTAVAVSQNSINLSWTDMSSDESGFSVERKESGGNFLVIGTVGANVTTFSVTGLLPGQEYCYRVRAQNVSGASGPSNEACATTDCIVPTVSSYAFSGNDFVVSVTGPESAQVKFYTSSDLVSWTEAGTSSIFEGTATFWDLNAASQERRFYRVNNGSCCSKVYGFSKVTAPGRDSGGSGGWAMVANPLNRVSNDLDTVMPLVQDGTTVYKWNGTGYDIFEYYDGFGWYPEGGTLSPGEGCFINSPTSNPLTVTFVGEVVTGQLMVSIASGMGIYSSKAPQSGFLDSNLGYTPSENDTVNVFNSATQSYITDSYVDGAWEGDSGGAAPYISVGQSFWINSGSAKNWTRLFSVCE